MLCAFLLNFGWAVEAPQSVADPEVMTYVDDFIEQSHGLFDYQYFRKYVRITFKEDLAHHIDVDAAIGVAWVTVYAPFEIELDTHWWTYADSNDRWQLVYHELGHAVCLLDHPPEANVERLFRFFDSLKISYVHGPFLPDGCPKDIMYPYAVSSLCVYEHRQYYITKLFKMCQKNIPINALGAEF
jgi:hypothetical protein